MAEELAAAKRRRSTMITSIENAATKLSRPDYMDKWDYDQLRQRQIQVEAKMADLKKEHSAVLDAVIEQNDRDQLIAEFDECDERYMDAIAAIERRLRIIAPQPAALPPPAAAPLVQVNIPENTTDTWGTFDGDKMKWFDWKGKFELAVHNSKKITPENKLRFLGNALRGRAADTIRKFELIVANYDNIWAALIEHYEQPYDVIYGYLEQFFSMKKLASRTDSTVLTDMVNVTNELLRQGKRAGFPVEHWDAVIVCSLHARLNAAHRLEWDKARGDNHRPTVEDMTKFLTQMARNAENGQIGSTPMHIRVQNEYATADVPGTMQRTPPVGRESKFPCSFCALYTHPAELCSKYVLNSLKVRNQMVGEARACRSCLKQGHFQDQCWAPAICNVPACRKARHHPTLCPFKEPNDMNVAAARFEDVDAPPEMIGHTIKSVPAGKKGAQYIFTARNRAGRGSSKRHGDNNDS